MEDFLFKEETYAIIGMCMEVHNILGPGFSEIVYKDALMHEADLRGIKFEREKEFKICYKLKILPHSFFADFFFFDKIIVEVKATDSSTNKIYIEQTLNYLKASGCRLGLIVNFGKKSLEHERLIF